MQQPVVSPNRPKVLIIDDDEGIRDLCTSIAAMAGFDTHTAATGAEGRERLSAILPEYVLLDLNLPDDNGLAILQHIRQQAPATRVVMITGYTAIDTAVEAMKLGAHDYITKPFPPDRLMSVLDARVTIAQPAPAAAPVRRFCDIIGVSNAMQMIYALIEKAARSDSTVLIEGESGTGKELVARAIHERSARAQEAFVPVDCGAIAPTLIESELFGHAAGAFTDARAARVGLLRSAEKGSVFLDEIGELPPSVQVKLLRALQEMEVRPVGSSISESLNCRIIAATNRDLSQAVSKGRFRRDLFYRLHVIPIFVPPLRERREDIPLLVEHFMRLCGQRAGREMSISPPALQQIMRYDWPGNVRELENAIQRAFALLDGDRIEMDDVPMLCSTARSAAPMTPVIEAPVAAAASIAVVSETAPENGSLLAHHEAQTIRKALADAHGNKRAAARALGIGIATLYRKLRKYEIGEG